MHNNVRNDIWAIRIGLGPVVTCNPKNSKNKNWILLMPCSQQIKKIRS